MTHVLQTSDAEAAKDVAAGTAWVSMVLRDGQDFYYTELSPVVGNSSMESRMSIDWDSFVGKESSTKQRPVSDVIISYTRREKPTRSEVLNPRSGIHEQIDNGFLPARV